jgi:hypothetical protein
VQRDPGEPPALQEREDLSVRQDHEVRLDWPDRPDRPAREAQLVHLEPTEPTGPMAQPELEARRALLERPVPRVRPGQRDHPDRSVRPGHAEQPGQPVGPGRRDQLVQGARQERQVLPVRQGHEVSRACRV